MGDFFFVENNAETDGNTKNIMFHLCTNFSPNKGIQGDGRLCKLQIATSQRNSLSHFRGIFPGIERIGNTAEFKDSVHNINHQYNHILENQEKILVAHLLYHE